jgi:hypothetical protein
MIYKRPRRKFGNDPVTYKNMTFDSKKEFYRYLDLELCQKAGKISGLSRQVRFELIPKQDGERAVHYTADFSYTEDGQPVVEDVKAPITKKQQDYIIRRKLMLFIHGIKIREV